MSTYVGTAIALAGAGAVFQDARWYSAALVLTLPSGVAALVGVYSGYALLEGVGGLFASTTTTDGNQASWLAIASGTVNVALFGAAALANVMAVRQIRKTRGKVAHQAAAVRRDDASSPHSSGSSGAY